MNERILELARQVWPDPNISHVNHMKFARLLIRECANVAADHEALDIYEEILEHFEGE